MAYDYANFRYFKRVFVPYTWRRRRPRYYCVCRRTGDVSQVYAKTGEVVRDVNYMGGDTCKESAQILIRVYSAIEIVPPYLQVPRGF